MEDERHVGDSFALTAISYVIAAINAGYGISGFVNPAIILDAFGWPAPVVEADQVLAGKFFQIYGIRALFAGAAIAIPTFLGDRRSAGTLLISFGLAAIVDGIACVPESAQWNHWYYAPFVILVGLLVLGIADGKFPQQRPGLRRQRRLNRRGRSRPSQSLVLTILANASSFIGFVYGFAAILQPAILFDAFNWPWPVAPNRNPYDAITKAYGARNILMALAIWLPTLFGGHKTMGVLIGCVGIVGIVDGFACLSDGAQWYHWSWAPLLILLSAVFLGAADAKNERLLKED